MKKTAVMLLVFMCVALLIGCAQKATDLESTGMPNYGENIKGKYTVIAARSKSDLDSGITLNEDETEKVMSSIAQSESENGWKDDLVNSAISCQIKINDDIYAYSASCGTLNNMEKAVSLELTEEAAGTINSVLSGYIELFY